MTAAGTHPLRAELERRFVTRCEEVSVGDTTVRLLRPLSPEALISDEDFERDERLPYWADLWPSAQVLAGIVLGTDGAGRTFLELGCGLGLVTIAAMRAGYRVTSTDYYDDALLFARANALDATGREPAVRMVDWRDLPDDLGRFDVVAAADVLYELPYAVLVAEAIARTLAPGGTAFVTDPGRIAAESFVEECRVRKMTVETEEVSWREGKVRQRIRVYCMRG